VLILTQDVKFKVPFRVHRSRLIAALLQTSGSFFSQSCITSIAIHSALIVFRLRPISLRGFLALVGSLWLSTFILGLAAPMIINHFVAVPFLVYHKTSCVLIE
jgi:hypothetical protein